MSALLMLTGSTVSFAKKGRKKNITDTDDILKAVANNITEYRNLDKLDLDWNAITETVDENGN